MGLLLFVDTETCGIPNDRLPDDHPAQPPLVQLGLILVDEDNGAEWATLDVVVRPNGWAIPSEATRCHGITTAAAELVGVPLSAVVPMYVHFRSRARMIVCHNPKFDLAIMRQAIARNGKPVTLAGPSEVFDTAEASAELVGIPPTESMRRWGRSGQKKTPKLVEAYRFFFGRDYDGAHTAIADARACKEVYFEIKKRTADSVAGAEEPIAIDATPIVESAAAEPVEPAFVTEARRDGAVE
jgi:DNA polymerase III subunit epsilon